MPTLSLAVASIMTFFTTTEGEAEAALQTQRKVIFDAVSMVVEGARTAVDFGAYSYGTNNHGGHLLYDVQSLENNADRDAFLAAIPGVNAAGVNTGYGSISSGSVRPLTGALYDAGYYFGADYTPVHDDGQFVDTGSNCGYNHIIVLTNGLPNNENMNTIGGEIGDADGDAYGDEASGGSADYGAGDHYLDDVAYRLHRVEDPNGDGDTGDITVHTVLAFQPSDPLVEHAAAMGGGQYYNAYNAQTLAEALSDLLVKIVLEADTAFVAPVVPASTTNRTISSDRVYLGLFKPQIDQAWIGNIKKYRVGTGETLVDRYGNDATSASGDFLELSLSYWGAVDTDGDGIDDLLKCSDDDINLYSGGDLVNLAAGDGGKANCGGVGGTLAARDLSNVSTSVGSRPPYTGARTIFTYTSASASKDLTHADNAFSTSNAKLHTADDGTPGPLAVDVVTVATARAEENDIINYVHGYEYGTTTQRRWPLGDILHSRPVVFNYSSYSSAYEETCYEDAGGGEFNSSVIYVGANDGMLHAFRDCDGRELWSFVPEQVLSYLKDSTDGTHQYFVDSPPVAYVHDFDNDGIIESCQW